MGVLIGFFSVQVLLKSLVGEIQSSLAEGLQKICRWTPTAACVSFPTGLGVEAHPSNT